MTYHDDPRNAAAKRVLALTDTVIERGNSYGHPLDHFTRTVAILGAVFGDRPMNTLRPEDWPLVMMCDKLARLGHTLDHDDSVRDIAGYAECWFAVKEERKERIKV